MKLYHIWQNKVQGWDTFSDAVVVANSAREARRMYPGSGWNRVQMLPLEYQPSSWANDPRDVKCKLIGEAHKSFTKLGFICKSFHAG